MLNHPPPPLIPPPCSYTAALTSRLYAPVLGNFSLRGFSADDYPTGVLLYERRYGGVTGPLAFNFTSEVYFNKSGTGIGSRSSTRAAADAALRRSHKSDTQSNVKFVGVVDHVYTPKYSSTLFRIARTPAKYILQITSVKYPRGAARGRLG